MFFSFTAQQEVTQSCANTFFTSIFCNYLFFECHLLVQSASLVKLCRIVEDIQNYNVSDPTALELREYGLTEIINEKLHHQSARA